MFLLQLPKKDNEVIVLSETPSEDFFKLQYYVYRGRFIYHGNVSPAICITATGRFITLLNLKLFSCFVILISPGFRQT